MNIFVLDRNPKQCAEWHMDKHVVKMPLETAQLLCTALNVNGQEALYKSTHKNHPCSIWARQTRENFVWLVELGKELCLEYERRYSRVHASFSVILDCFDKKESIPDGPITEFVQAMPQEYKRQDPVDGYRTYYIYGKIAIASWKLNKPNWWINTE